MLTPHVSERLVAMCDDCDLRPLAGVGSRAMRNAARVRYFADVPDASEREDLRCVWDVKRGLLGRRAGTQGDDLTEGAVAMGRYRLMRLSLARAPTAPTASARDAVTISMDYFAWESRSRERAPTQRCIARCAATFVAACSSVCLTYIPPWASIASLAELSVLASAYGMIHVECAIRRFVPWHGVPATVDHVRGSLVLSPALFRRSARDLCTSGRALAEICATASDRVARMEVWTTLFQNALAAGRLDVTGLMVERGVARALCESCSRYHPAEHKVVQFILTARSCPAAYRATTVAWLTENLPRFVGTDLLRNILEHAGGMVGAMEVRFFVSRGTGKHRRCRYEHREEYVLTSGALETIRAIVEGTHT